MKIYKIKKQRIIFEQDNEFLNECRKHFSDEKPLRLIDKMQHLDDRIHDYF